MADTAVALQGFGGGVNQRDAPNQLAPNEARNLVNMLLDERGGAVKRLGCSQAIGSLAGKILSAHWFERAGASSQLIMHLDDGSVRYSTDLTTVAGSIVTGVSTSAPYSFCTFNGKVYMSNGVNNYAKWDGTTYTDFAGLPKPAILAMWKDAMWGANYSGTTDLVRSSAAGDAETWPAANQNYMGRGDGDSVTALYSYGNYLLAFKANSTYLIYDVNLSSRLTDPSIGCVGKFAVVGFDGNCFFLSRKGIFRWVDESNQLLSGKIDPVFNLGYLATDLSMASAYRIGNRIGFCVPELGQTVANVQIEGYPRYEGFPIAYHRMPIRFGLQVRTSAGELLYGSSKSTSALVKCLDAVGTDLSAAFSGAIETGWYDMGQPLLNKYLRWARVFARGKFNLEFASNYREVGRAVAIDLPVGNDTWGDGLGTDLWSGGTDPNDLWGPSVNAFSEIGVHPDVYGYQFGLRAYDLSAAVVGNRVTKFADVPVAETVGYWGLYNVVLHGIEMGDRV